MLYSPACERNKQPILEVLQDWLKPGSRVLEIGSGSGQHARFFCSRIEQLHWQTSERPEVVADLAAALATPQAGLQPEDHPQAFSRGDASQSLAAGSQLPPPLALDMTCSEDWPRDSYDAVFTANTCHILPASALPQLLAGSRRVLQPGGLLLLYGPFHDHGVHTAESNAAFDAHLRSLDPRMGVRDAADLQEQGRGLGFAPLADVAMPANNRMLIVRAAGGGVVGALVVPGGVTAVALEKGGLSGPCSPAASPRLPCLSTLNQPEAAASRHPRQTRSTCDIRGLLWTVSAPPRPSAACSLP